MARLPRIVVPGQALHTIQRGHGNPVSSPGRTAMTISTASRRLPRALADARLCPHDQPSAHPTIAADPIEATAVGRQTVCATNQRSSIRTVNGTRAMDEQHAHVTVATLADAVELASLTPAPYCPGIKPKLGGEMAAVAQAAWITGRGTECGGSTQADAGCGRAGAVRVRIVGRIGRARRRYS